MWRRFIFLGTNLITDAFPFNLQCRGSRDARTHWRGLRVARVEIIGWIMHINRFPSGISLGKPGRCIAAMLLPPPFGSATISRQRAQDFRGSDWTEARPETMQPGYFSASVQTQSLDRSLGPPTRGNRSEIRRNRFPRAVSFWNGARTMRKNDEFYRRPGAGWSRFPTRSLFPRPKWFTRYRACSKLIYIDARCIKNEYDVRALIFELIVRERNISKTLCDVITGCFEIPPFILSSNI